MEPKAYQSIFSEGQADDLESLLRRRLNAVPPWAAQHSDAASIAQLDACLDAIFDAQSVAGLIGGEHD
ncbi:MAG: hypothetical protein EOM10_18225 [Opitutae bacterium]|nr:hypothetical protein [Opitutae bacterium]